MSQKLFVSFRNDGFWAYDVAVGILIKHVIDRAEERCRLEDIVWLRECIEHWRVNAVISDFGLHLEDDWDDEHVQLVRQLIDDACRDLSRREFIPAEEMLAWDILEGEGVFPRGALQFPTAPVIELGCAIQSLFDRTLPKASDGRRWLFGTDTGRQTI